jgi:hypothetical protein
MVEKSFSDAKTLISTYGKCAARVCQRLNEMRASPNLAAFIKLPAPCFQHLSPLADGRCSVVATSNTSFELELPPNLLLTPDGIPDYQVITEITIKRIWKIK